MLKNHVWLVSTILDTAISRKYSNIWKLNTFSMSEKRYHKEYANYPKLSDSEKRTHKT